MADYLHGAYGFTQALGNKAAVTSKSAIVYVGTAPVHNIEGGAKNVNRPILVNNMAEAKKYFGYSDDWASFTLCEAMSVHLDYKGVGPLVLINVFDPTKAAHKESTGGTAEKTPSNGQIVLTSAKLVYLDSLVIKTQASPAVTKELGVDYSVKYNADKETITITELSSGSLGSSPLDLTWDIAKPSGVDASDVVGSTDGLGTNTGLYAIKDVYQLTGLIPSYLGAPGFSSDKTVHDAMKTVSLKINGHWDAYMFTDLPLKNGGTDLTLDTIAAYKASNGFNADNETVYFPLAEGVDDNIYHLSVLAAANFQTLLSEQEGIPYKSASNTDCDVIRNLYLGASNTGKVYDDTLINNKLNKNGIASAAYVGGRWAIWGAHSASYNQSDANQVNVSETNRMMLYYISNDFQHRRPPNVDKPMTRNDLLTIVAEEQSRLDALRKTGALIYGQAKLDAIEVPSSDIMGDYAFTFEVTVTPLAKSLTAVVNWTDEGFVTYYESLA
jgi:Phage tail sheath protein FI